MDISKLVNDAGELERFYLRLSKRSHGTDRSDALNDARALLDFVSEPYDGDSNAVVLSAAASVALLLKESLRFGRSNERDFIREQLDNLDTMADMTRTSEMMHNEWSRRR